jgi:peptidoglycan/xylan/chitin deacetylase (PgdA/CDA1 family)
MRIPGIKTAKNSLRWLRAQVYGGGLILGYHRVSSSRGALDEVCVSPENFAEHLHEIRKRTHPIRLSELVRHLRDGCMPDRSIAITFDDGYADNLYAAKPLLEKYEIPATVFICTGSIGKEFWWDELERLVLSSPADPRALDLRVGRAQFKWNPPPVNSETDNPKVHRQFHWALYHFLLSLDVEDQDHAMEFIRNWSEVSSLGISTSRAMSEDELLRIVEGGLIELGAHTRHHAMLPKLPLERQREEIQSSKRDLEMLLGEKVSGFSYPNGRATVESKRLVRESGFIYACTSLHDVVRPGSDLYELTRFWQPDVDGESFVKRLNRWMKLKVH